MLVIEYIIFEGIRDLFFCFFFWSGEGGMDEGEKEFLFLGFICKVIFFSLFCIFIYDGEFVCDSYLICGYD